MKHVEQVILFLVGSILMAVWLFIFIIHADGDAITEGELLWCKNMSKDQQEERECITKATEN